MRILITSFTFAPQANGVAAVVGAHASGLVRRGHEVTVATGFDVQRASMEFPSSLRVEEFKICQGPTFSTSIGEDIQRYEDFIRRFPTDIILCHCWQVWSTNLAAAVMAHNRARKILVSHGFSAHMWMRSKRFPWGFGQWLRSQRYVLRMPKMLQAFDHVVFLSPRVDWGRFFDHRVVNFLGRPEWSVIPNGTFPEQFSDTAIDFRAQHGIGREFMLLNVAVYVESKNQEASLRAFLQADLENSILVFIGNEMNDYARRLQRLCAELSERDSKGRVLFLEKLDRTMIRAAYRAADLLVMSSRGETQPLAILDAMASGKPFLSTPVGCVSDLPGGLVVSGKQEMAARMRELYLAPQRRAALGRAGYEACQTTYHWNSVLDDYEVLFEKMAGQSSAPSARAKGRLLRR